ncbi:sce7726 family protein [Campylobacter sp. MOP7]|uniref:sce7726 family protein n=1 Tax=Campylobacter canis TaxID=3378588 RepID=UPI00387E2D72
MNEKDFKILLLKHLYKGFKDATVVTEFGFSEKPARQTDAISDIFMISKGDMHVFEIKSPKDTLERLKSQVDVYLEHVNYVNVCVDPKFLKELDFLPNRVGIYTIDNKEIIQIREAIYGKVATQRYLDHLWLNELMKLLRGFSTEAYTQACEECMRKHFTKPQIKAIVLFRLQERLQEESDRVKEYISSKAYDKKIPGRIWYKNPKVTPIKDIPFGTMLPFLKNY